MSDQENYTTSFTVDQTPDEVYAAINNPRAWWSEEIKGDTDKLDAVFDYHFRDIHNCQLKVTVLEPGKKVVWHVLDSYMNFIKETDEWKDTDITFEITEKDGKTEVVFTHVGLKPQDECYGVCYDAWKTYINGSLRDLITAGKGNPNVGEAITEGEKQLS
jgi:hypothetical protein